MQLWEAPFPDFPQEILLLPIHRYPPPDCCGSLPGPPPLRTVICPLTSHFFSRPLGLFLPRVPLSRRQSTFAVVIEKKQHQFDVPVAGIASSFFGSLTSGHTFPSEHVAYLLLAEAFPFSPMSSGQPPSMSHQRRNYGQALLFSVSSWGASSSSAFLELVVA